MRHLSGFALLATIGTLVWLHLRRRRRDRDEQAADPFPMSDYGLEEPAGRTPKPPKENQKAPSQSTGGSASLQSLERSLRQHQDPFGSQAELAGNNAASFAPGANRTRVASRPP